MSLNARRRHLPPEVAEFSGTPTRPEVANHCKDCRFAAPNGPNFYCRRNPPVVLQARPGISLWPTVKPNDWCGDFSLGNASDGRF